MNGLRMFVLFGIVLSIFFASPASLAKTPTPTSADLMMEKEEATDGAMMADDPGKKSEYVLPYPGILQDHPLYFLKQLRDRIIEFLVVDPVRKAEFYLLQSDKFLGSSVMLEEKGKKDVAQTVLNDSTQKMTSAVAQLTLMKSGDKQVPPGLVERLENAIEKHLEVLDELSSKDSVDTTGARDALIKAQEELVKVKG